MFENFGQTKEVYIQEKELISKLKTYREKVIQIRDKLETFLNRSNGHDYNDETFTENPINTYILIKTHGLALPRMQLIHEMQELKRDLNKSTTNFPTTSDYYGALYGLVTLEDTYQFNTTLAAQGIISLPKFPSGQRVSMQSPHRMTYIDLKKMADLAFQKAWYDTSILFLKGAFNLIADLPEHEKPSNETMKKFNLMKQSLVRLNNQYITKKLIMADSTYKVFPFTIDKNMNEKVKQPKVIRDNIITYVNLNCQSGKEFYMRSVCNGFSFKGYTRPVKQFHCHWLHHQDPFLRLGPLKLEHVSDDPYLVVFHQIFTDTEMEYMVDTSRPHLSRTRVVGMNKGTVAHDFKGGKKRRIVSKSVQHWMNDLVYEDMKEDVTEVDNKWNYTVASPVLWKLSKKLEQATRLNLTAKYSSTGYQVTNYGLGGLCEVHIDPHGYLDGAELPPSRYHLRKTGDMFATIMGWIEKEPIGGATAFCYPYKEVLVWPTKGSAAFWYDLNLKGSRNIHTNHGGCPVLKGSKWILNKWVYYFDQYKRYPCRLDQTATLRTYKKTLRELTRSQPIENDFITSAKGLLMILDTYNVSKDCLTKKEFVYSDPHRGRVSLKTHATFEPHDLMTLADEATQIGWFSHAIDLTKSAYANLNVKSLQKDQKQVMEDFKSRLVRTHNNILRSKKRLVGEGYKVLPYLVTDDLKRKPTQPKFVKKLDPSKREHKFEANEQLDINEDIFRRICRGQIVGQAVKNQTKYQKCHWLHQNNPYLRLNPFKIEILLNDPFRMIFHEILNEEEMNWLIQYSTPNLSQARKVSKTNLEVNRVGLPEEQKRKIVHKTVQCWIDDVIYNEEANLKKNKDGIFEVQPYLGDQYAHVIFNQTLHKLSKKIQMATNMIITQRWSSTKYQVTNYGLGGLCETHVDPFGIWEGAEVHEEMKEIHSTGDMFATFMAWLGNVPGGGYTAFNHEGYEQAVVPVRGSAAFWFNLRSDMKREPRSSHGGCPVLAGSKWILNKWIMANDQFHNFKCTQEKNVTYPPYKDFY
eukprot:TCALIF_06702-PA protein Name:"Similar to P4HA2 Prolyl 4-hydroxylase subunit alpha-2 (Gallus gallus)" AED:0.31 eAED:0.31 QI:0/0/0/1/0/0/2/0/1029